MRVRITESLHDCVIKDLRRPHRTAHERMGLLLSAVSETSDGLLLLPTHYMPIPDDLYERDQMDGTVLLGAKGIRFAMTQAVRAECSCSYIHLHSHRGPPGLSGPDRRHADSMIDDLLHAYSEVPQGYLVTSLSAINGVFKTRTGQRPTPLSSMSRIGQKLTKVRYATRS